MAGAAVVVLTVDATAGQGRLIYLCSAADWLEETAFRSFFQPFLLLRLPCLWGNLSHQNAGNAAQIQECAIFPAASAPQRYNILDFPVENRVPKWARPPLDTPAKENAVPLWTLRHFPCNGTQTVKCSLIPLLRKCKIAVASSFAEIKSTAIFILLSHIHVEQQGFSLFLSGALWPV